jgi:hypothetical protein
MMLLRRKIQRLAIRLIGVSRSKSNSISPYGKHLLSVGKWKVTSKGILLERNKFGECDYFLNDSSLLDTDHLVSEINRLHKAGWLTELDCYQFAMAWYQKVSAFKNLSRMEVKDMLWWILYGSTFRFIEHSTAGKISLNQ